jgi:hypothetical protein
MDDFYTYTLTNSLTSSVFYVGKGRGDRIQAHERNARKGVQSPVCDTIRQIWNDGGSIITSKVCENMSNGEAFLLEDRLIRKYGIANLTNRSMMGNQNALGKGKPRSKQLVQVGVSVSGTLRDQIEASMDIDGIEYSRENCYQYVKDICHKALLDHIRQKNLL